MTDTPSREDCIAAAGRAFARACARQAAMSPAEAARAAYQSGGPSVEELTERIRARRQAEAATHRPSGA